MSDLSAVATPELNSGRWQLDPQRSSIEFAVPHFYGLMKVKGRFTRYTAELELNGEPAVALTVEADSIDTGNPKRDKHLRSKDFFKVTEHPTLGFSSTSAELRGDTLRVRGVLEALGNSATLDVPLRVSPTGDGYEVEGTVELDQRQVGLRWSPLGITRTPTTISLRGRLTR
jgi:polyisoprenoid-binding protein YceI